MLKAQGRSGLRNARGFTLVELIIVMVVLGIMAALAIPKFLDIRADAKKSAVQGGLGGVRSAVANFKGKQISSGAATVTPTAVQIEDKTSVLDGPVPDNPYAASSPKNKVNVCTTAKGTVDTGAGITDAWCYKVTGTGDQAVGEFWANSNVAGENAL